MTLRSLELGVYPGTVQQAIVECTGHSVVHEAPYLSPADQTVLQSGMIVMLEPNDPFRK